MQEKEMKRLIVVALPNLRASFDLLKGCGISCWFLHVVALPFLGFT